MQASISRNGVLVAGLKQFEKLSFYIDPLSFFAYVLQIMLP